MVKATTLSFPESKESGLPVDDLQQPLPRSTAMIA
jgi:hypothetical protein